MRMTVERRFGAGVNTPAEFNRLSEDIGVRIGVSLSASTLMRVWGYVASAARPNMSTLNTLARYAGYRDFRQFVDNGGIDREASEDVVSPRITVADDLAVRDRVRLTWQPDRECVVRYLGGGQFVVEQALATKLHPGDLLFTDGHVMMYLGRDDNGEPYVIHAGSSRWFPGEGEEGGPLKYYTRRVTADGLRWFKGSAKTCLDLIINAGSMRADKKAED